MPETIPVSSLAPGTRAIMSGTHGPVLQALTWHKTGYMYNTYSTCVQCTDLLPRPRALEVIRGHPVLTRGLAHPAPPGLTNEK